MLVVRAVEAEPSRVGAPDGLVDERRLVDAAARLGALQLDPIKTTVVQGLRAMTTWVLGRPLAGA